MCVCVYDYMYFECVCVCVYCAVTSGTAIDLWYFVRVLCVESRFWKPVFVCHCHLRPYFLFLRLFSACRPLLRLRPRARFVCAQTAAAIGSALLDSAFRRPPYLRVAPSRLPARGAWRGGVTLGVCARRGARARRQCVVFNGSHIYRNALRAVLSRALPPSVLACLASPLLPLPRIPPFSRDFSIVECFPKLNKYVLLSVIIQCDVMCLRLTRVYILRTAP